MNFNLYRALIEKDFLIQSLSLLQCYSDMYHITVCNNKPAEFTIYGSSHDKAKQSKF